MTETIGTAAAEERFTFAPHLDLPSLRHEWSDLAARSDNVFATYEWLVTWWHHFGRGRPLALTAVHDAEGELVAILPLYVAAERPVRVLRFLGHGLTDQLGPVCAVADRDRARQALSCFLTGPDAPAWDLVIADELPPSDRPLGPARLLARSPTHVASLADVGASGADWRAARSANLRAQLSKGRRLLDEAGTVTFRTTTEARAVAEDLEVLLDLHRRRWDPTGGSRSFTDREAFHHEIARTFLERGWLRLRFLELDGEPVAGLYGFRFHGAESHYQSGREPAFERCSVGLLLHEHAITTSADEGVREYRFLRGDEAYKRRFADRTATQESVSYARGQRGVRAQAAITRLPRLSRTQARWVPAALAWGTGGTPRWGPP